MNRDTFDIEPEYYAKQLNHASERRDAERLKWRMRVQMQCGRTIAKQIKRRILAENGNAFDRMHRDAIY